MTTIRARDLRQRSTGAEKKLWRLLRNRQIDNVKFRRQVPLGPYVVDFLAVGPRLVIELDGGQHATDPADAVRTKWLEREGYRIVRFWNNDVLSNPESVIALIFRAISR